MARRRTMGEEPITTQEAGRRGGTATSRKYGKEFYQSIGKKGGQTVRKLIEEGRRAMGR